MEDLTDEDWNFIRRLNREVADGKLSDEEYSRQNEVRFGHHIGQV